MMKSSNTVQVQQKFTVWVPTFTQNAQQFHNEPNIISMPIFQNNKQRSYRRRPILTKCKRACLLAKYSCSCEGWLLRVGQSVTRRIVAWVWIFTSSDGLGYFWFQIWGDCGFKMGNERRWYEEWTKLLRLKVGLQMIRIESSSNKDTQAWLTCLFLRTRISLLELDLLTINVV